MQVFRNGWFLFICVAMLIVANMSLYRAVFATRVLEMYVLDAGEKGSATLLRTPGNMTVLINAGPNASILRALGSALPLWQRRIDAVVLAGTKTALASGLSDVERRYRVSTVVRAGDARVPYGAALVFDGARLTIVSPETFTISYGATSFAISSTTPAGVYISDGKTITKN